MINQRTHPRTTISWRAALVEAGKRNIIHARAVEISQSGAGLLSDEVLPVGMRYQLFLEVIDPARGNRQAIELACQVVHSTLVGNISQFRSGVKFTSQSQALQAALARLRPQ